MLNNARSYLAKKLFILADKKYFSAVDTFEEIDQKVFERSFLPLLVVGREHYTESEKHYPVDDLKELKNIVKLESDALSLIDYTKQSTGGHLVRKWVLDEFASAVVKDKLCCWFPEGYLLSFSAENGFYNIKRNGKTIYFLKEKSRCITAIARGVYSSEQAFLFSNGATSEFSSRHLDDEQYLTYLMQGITSLSFQNWVSLLTSYKLWRKISTQFNMPSLAVGGMLGLVLFNSMYVGYLEFRINSITEQVRAQKSATVLQLKQEIEKENRALKKLTAKLEGESLQERIWSLTASVMSLGSKVLLVRAPQEDADALIRLESEKATETLNSIMKLSYVEDAQFATSVAKSQGKSRFSIKVKFLTQGKASGKK